MDKNDRWGGRWVKPKIQHGIPTIYNWLVLYPSGLIMEYGVDVGAFSLLQAEAGIYLGENVQIGSSCSIYSVDTIGERRGRVVIAKNARIGSHTVIMPGVTIGEGAICGAHSYIDKDVPAHAKLIPPH